MTTILSKEAAEDIPTATVALPSTVSRRLPPPCWTPEETAGLIDAYRDKWYSLNRGNLRANHWQEVADDVAFRCPAGTPKTAVQCRHKMEKLRKRYRTEIQRVASNGGVRRFSSSWVLFEKMHAMERGSGSGSTNPPSPPSSSDSDEEDTGRRTSIGFINHLCNLKDVSSNHVPRDSGSTPGVRIKIPGAINSGPAAAKLYSSNYPNPSPRFTGSASNGYVGASNAVTRDGFHGKRTAAAAADITPKDKGDSGLGEVAAAIHSLGEGFQRIEKAKMDLVQQIEEMKMEMELKRTEMILESQKRIVETFAHGISQRSVKKSKRTTTMDMED